MKYTGQNTENFEILNINHQNVHHINSIEEDGLSLIWFTDNINTIRIDSYEHTFKKNQIICLTEFNKIEYLQITGCKILAFNKGFYCVLNHDSEVSCKGILYYGSQQLPIINLTTEDADILTTVWKMLEIEMKSRDELQLEMLQMMLKRILILTTRAYKKQVGFADLETEKVDIIRDYHFLVEKHFATKHSVTEYAEMMNKSPKTLSNTFKKLGNKTPLDIIRDRVLLEAKRLLSYTSTPISEIGYELGFNDIQSFSRFFKKKTGVSATDFRENQPKGKK